MNEMEQESSQPQTPSAVIALSFLLVLAVGGLSPAPAACQEGGEDVTDCTADKITLDDGEICVHGLDCEDGTTADKLCFRLPQIPGD